MSDPLSPVVGAHSSAHAHRPSLQSLAEDPMLALPDDDSLTEPDDEQHQHQPQQHARPTTYEHEQVYMEPARPASLNDATSAVADVYTHLARSYNPSQTSERWSSQVPAAASLDEPLTGDKSHSWQRRSFVSHSSTHTRVSHPSGDPLSSPQPATAPKPHPRAEPLASLDEQFHATRTQSEFALGGGGRDVAGPSSSTRTRSTRSGPSSSPRGSQTRTSMNTSSRARLVSSTPASSSVRVLDSNVSRARWLENKRFVLASLSRALESKRGEVETRLASLGGDRLACEHKLLATLEAYIRRTGRALQGYVDETTRLRSQVDETAQRVDVELRRFDLTAGPEEKTDDAHAHDANQFDALATHLDDEIQSILAAIRAHGNFALDADAIPAFDPFQAEKVRRLEAEKAQLEARVSSMSLNGDLAAAGSQPHNDTQELLTSLQTQLDELTTRHVKLTSDHARLQTDHASLAHALKHERRGGTAEKDAAVDRVHSLEESLRVEQSNAQSLAKQLDERMHELSLLNATLSSERIAHVATVKRFQTREADFLSEAESLRKQSAAQFESHTTELKAAHARLQQAQVEGAEDRARFEAHLQQDAAVSTQALQTRLNKEKNDLESRLAQAKQSSERRAAEHTAEVRRMREDAQRREKQAVEDAAHKDAMSAQQLQMVQAALDAARAELDATKQSASETVARREEDRRVNSHAERQASERLAAEVSNATEARRLADQAAAEAKAQTKAAADARAAELALRMELQQTKLNTSVLEDKCRSLQSQVDQSKKDRDADARRKADDDAATQVQRQQVADLTVRLQSVQLELDLLRTSTRESVQTAEAARLHAEKQLVEQQARVRALEQDLVRAQQDSDSAIAKLEVSLQATNSALAAAQTKQAQTLASHEAEVTRYAQLHRDMRDASGSEVQKVRASIDAQVELALTRFILSHKDRLEAISKAVAERAAADPTAEPEHDAAVHALRQAVQSSETASHPFEFGGALGASSAAAPSLAETKQQFESLVSSVESHLQRLFALGATQRQRAADRFQAMLQSIKRSAREQLQEAEADAAARAQQAHEEHASAMAAASEASDSALSALTQERDALASQLATLERESRLKFDETVHSYESLLDEERVRVESHFTGLMEQAKEEHVHDAEVWEEQRRGIEEARRRREEELERARDEAAEQHAHTLATLREENRRLQTLLDEADARHRGVLNSLSVAHQTTLDESLALYARKHALEVEVIRAEHDAETTRLRSDALRERDEADRVRQTTLAELEARYVAQLDRVRVEHETELTAATNQSLAQRDAQADTHAETVAALQQAHESELREREQVHMAEIRARDEALATELRTRDDALATELRVRDEVHQGELRAQAEAHARELDQIHSGHRHHQLGTLNAIKTFLTENHASIIADMEDMRDEQRRDASIEYQEAQAVLARIRAESEEHKQALQAVNDIGADIYEQQDSGLYTHRSIVTDASATTSSTVGGLTSSQPHTDRSSSAAAATSSSSSSGASTVSTSSGSTRSHLPSAVAATLQRDEDLSILQSSLLSSARRFKERIRNLQLQLAQTEREKDRLIVEMDDRLERETSDTKTYAESLSQRWKSLSEAHDQLTAKHATVEEQLSSLKSSHAEELRVLQDQFQSQRSQLQTEVVNAEYKAHKEQESVDRITQEMKEKHTQELSRLSDQHVRALEDLKARSQSALSETSSKHDAALQAARIDATTETMQLRKSLESAHAQQLRQVREQYEGLLRVSDASLAQQQSSLRALEESERSLNAIIDSHDEKLHALHQAHLQDLHKRLTTWRSTRRNEVEEEEEFLALKMEAIKQNYTKREDALCKSCRQKPGSTTFRAALNRLCDEATRPSKHRAMNVPAVLRDDVPVERVINDTPPVAAATVPARHAMADLSSTRTARAADSPTTIAAKYTASSMSHATRPAALVPPSTAAPSGESPSPPSFMPPPALASSQPRTTDGETVHRLTPVSKQEGVLTLRFHSAASRARTEPESTLVTTTADFTPAETTPHAADTTDDATTYQSMLDKYLSGEMDLINKYQNRR